MATQLLLIAAFVFSMFVMSLNYRKRKKKVMFISGASIESAIVPGAYISQLVEILKKENIDDKYTLLTVGIRSQSIQEVFEKIEVEVLDKGPDIVIVNFALTDMMGWLSVEKKEFDAFLKSIVKRLIDAKISVIICQPMVTEEEAYYLNQKGIEWSNYSSLIDNIAAKNNLPVIDMNNVARRLIGEENLQKMFAIELFKALKEVK